VRIKDRQVLGISALGPQFEHTRISKFRRFISDWYLSYFVPQLARSQPISGADPHLDRTGGNLANYLQYVQREKPRETLNKAFAKIPDFCKFYIAKYRD
jgi:hypothetical protein